MEKKYKDKIIAHSREEFPKEACGILAGFKDERSEEVMERVYPCENVYKTPEAGYLINPIEELEIFESLEGEEIDVIGFYHSHPSGPFTPSGIDACRANSPGYIHVIAFPQAKEIKAWRWLGEEFEGEEIEISN